MVRIQHCISCPQHHPYPHCCRCLDCHCCRPHHRPRPCSPATFIHRGPPAPILLRSL
ncbi:hypothetical protein I314_02687 [Cryptococcus bacillisporus CA1873]|uniref:Copper-fist domain-containing protein n=1 Tax=Cryptococcus bacillisporus CA1873 TaxID=1296111 RepID=A0ABR5BC70_CRYGA|nr:hypothetical protein I314_02687 [Cryptococcus bacillisporus CA1873]|eukprot:KIR63906.1 hypothetical protein I314_02687 [Cryptococcus gattii CA1873]